MITIGYVIWAAGLVSLCGFWLRAVRERYARRETFPVAEQPEMSTEQLEAWFRQLREMREREATEDEAWWQTTGKRVV